MIWNKPGQDKPGQDGGSDPWQDKSGKSTPPRRGAGKPPPSWLPRRFNRFLRGPSSLAWLALAVVVVWLLLSAYISIGPGQVGVVTRFGRYQRTLDPGLHLKLPQPFETVRKIEWGRVHSLSDSVEVLTCDRNLIDADFTVQYQVVDPRRYLFVLANTDGTVAELGQLAVKSVLAVAAKRDLEQVDPAALAASIRQRLQQALDRYQAGLKIESVGLTHLAPPAQVKETADVFAAVQAANRVQADAADAYAAQRLPEAREEATQRVEAARAALTLRSTHAQAEVDRFQALLAAYRAAPAATRRALWQDTVTQVLAANTKIVDNSGGHVSVSVSVRGGLAAVPRAAASPPPAASAPTAAAPVIPAEPASAASAALATSQAKKEKALSVLEGFEQ